MAIALSQAYSHFVQERPRNPDSNNVNARESLYDLKEAFIAGGGWTVWGSHDGQDNLGNNDAVDRWTSPSQIDRSLSNRDPWMVLQGPVALGSPQVCIAADYSSGNNWLFRWSIVVSPSGSFGSGAGGTDGTTTARPTAPDEVQDIDASSGNSMNSGTDDFARTTAAAEGADGQLFIWFRQGALISHFLAFVLPDNAPGTLDNGFAWITQQNQVSVANCTEVDLGAGRQFDHFQNANWRGIVSGTQRNMYLGSRGYNNASWSVQGSVRADNIAHVTQCDLFASNIVAQGYYGSVPDLYYCPQLLNQVLLGDTAGGSPKFIALDSLILPWDPTAAQPLSRLR